MDADSACVDRAPGRARLSKCVRLVVSVSLLAWLAWRTDWARIGQAIDQIHIEYWVLAVAVYFVAQVISAYRWRALAVPLGFRESFARFTALYFVGMFFNLALPTSVGGDVVRAWSLDNQSGRRIAAFLSVFVDRFSGLLILLLVACIGAMVCPVPLPTWVHLSVWGSAAAACGGLAVLPVLGRFGTRHSGIQQVHDAIAYYTRRPRLLGVTTILSVAVQLANVVVVWFVGEALGLSVPFAYYAVFVPLVTLLTLAPISLNGMGIREAGAVLFLAPFGIDEGSALCLSVLWFFVLTAVSLSGGGVYLWGLVVRNEVLTDHDAVGSHSHQGRERQPAAAA